MQPECQQECDTFQGPKGAQKVNRKKSQEREKAMGSIYQEMPTGYYTPKMFVKLADTTMGMTVLASSLLETMSNFLKNIFVDWFRKRWVCTKPGCLWHFTVTKKKSIGWL